jgi:hypothetical protein
MKRNFGCFTIVLNTQDMNTYTFILVAAKFLEHIQRSRVTEYCNTQKRHSLATCYDYELFVYL